jgi:hypothetical protein
MPHTHYPQPAGGFGGLGGLYAPPPPAPFSFPEVFQSYSGSTPTIGKTFPGASATSNVSTVCHQTMIGDFTSTAHSLTTTTALGSLVSGTPATAVLQSKRHCDHLTFKTP